MTKEKMCSQCKILKPLSEFYWRGISLNTKCKTCIREYNKSHMGKKRSNEVNVNIAYGRVS